MQKETSIPRILVMASGEGTNFQALVREIEAKHLPVKIVAFVSNNPQANALNIAQKANIEHYVFPLKSYKDRPQQEKQILDLASELKVDWIFLAGYMKILSPEFVQEFHKFTGSPYRIINIHPSLLPKYPGPKSYEKAFHDDCSDNGITIHFVDEGVDTGPAIIQEKFPRYKEDTLNDFIARGKSLEHKTYSKVLRDLALGQLKPVVTEGPYDNRK